MIETVKIQSNDYLVNRDANTWITGIRMLENTAIANGTALADIVWN